MGETLTFGRWLQQRRRRHDLTQAELAQLAGCAIGTLRNIEADDARPSKQLAARIARALEVAEAEIDAVVAFARGTAGAPGPAAARPPGDGAPRLSVPAQLTYLIGRHHDVANVCALLQRPDVRLVTLTGPGGTGKTRVAVEAARQLARAFGDDVTFVDLSALGDRELVLPTIAQTLGTPANRSLAAALRERTCLLLLDNFEQVVAATPELVELLGACPGVKVLVTSRIALGVPGEHEWPIPPLTLPDLAQLPPFDQLSQYEAVRLFSERARAASPQFAITSANAAAVAEICHQLDGLPLAIELAAARVKLFAPQALLARLDRRLEFLVGGERVRPTRQQTVRNTIDWSYRLLVPAEQELFQRLSLFVDGAALSTIEAVCGEPGGPGDGVLAVVAALANHNLLRRVPPGPDEADDDPRFGMLETIRDYALERLAADPGAAAARRRHAEHFIALAEALAAEWGTPRISQAIARQRREHNNMRAALQWAADTGNPAAGLRLATALWGFWRSYGYGAEGLGWLGQLLQLDAASAAPAAGALRLRALHAAAWLASDRLDFAAATSYFEQSSALRQALGEAELSVDLLLNAARQARQEGAYQQAAALLESALPQRDPAADGARPGLSLDGLGQLLRELALILRERGEYERATALMDEGRALFAARGDRLSAALAQLGLGDIARDQGDGAGLHMHAEPALAVFREFGMQWATGFALNTLALGARYAGDLPRAAALIDESVALFRGLRADASLAEALISQASILRARRELGAAHAAAREALQLALDGAPQLFVAAGLEELANGAAARGLAAQAATLLAAAEALREQMGAPVRPAERGDLALAAASARRALGDEAFAAARATARRLPLDQILSTLDV